MDFFNCLQWFSTCNKSSEENIPYYYGGDFEIVPKEEFSSVKESIHNLDPIEENLHVIIVISNPCLYESRYRLANEFVKRFEKEKNCILYIVELAYKDQIFKITESGNPRHLQLRVDTPLWHKENMINLGVKKLLPSTWKAFAWIDADLEFESASWALDTLKILNGYKDIVQLFSHVVDMNKNNLTNQVFTSFGYQYSKGNMYCSYNSPDYWHPGMSWAMTRKSYEKIGGLYEHSILGSGDYIMAKSIIGKVDTTFDKDSTDAYKKSGIDFQKNMSELKLGYTPGVIRHYFHGLKKNRFYSDRAKILVKHKYDPYLHITYNSQGLLIPSKTCPEDLLKEINEYFYARLEDE